MSSHGSRRQIRQCKRYATSRVPVPVPDTRDARAPAAISDSISSDDDDEGEPALVATSTARLSRIYSGITSAETNTTELLLDEDGELCVLFTRRRESVG